MQHTLHDTTIPVTLTKCQTMPKREFCCIDSDEDQAPTWVKIEDSRPDESTSKKPKKQRTDVADDEVVFVKSEVPKDKMEENLEFNLDSPAVLKVSQNLEESDEDADDEDDKQEQENSDGDVDENKDEDKEEQNSEKKEKKKQETHTHEEWKKKLLEPLELLKTIKDPSQNMLELTNRFGDIMNKHFQSWWGYADLVTFRTIRTKLLGIYRMERTSKAWEMMMLSMPTFMGFEEDRLQELQNHWLTHWTKQLQSQKDKKEQGLGTKMTAYTRPMRKGVRKPRAPGPKVARKRKTTKKEGGHILQAQLAEGSNSNNPPMAAIVVDYSSFDTESDDA